MTVASEAILKGQSFYRLRQTLVSPGDIFPIDIGAAAIAVGPESDISAYDVYYFDPLAGGAVEKFLLTADQPFVSGLFAQNDSQVAQTATSGNAAETGQIIVAPRDLYVPQAIRNSIGATDGLVLIPPMIDLMIYTQMPVQLPVERAEKRIAFPVTLNASGDETWVFVPVYGRRLLTGQITGSPTTGSDFDIQFGMRNFLQPFSDTAGQTTIGISWNLAASASGVNQAGFNYDADDYDDPQDGSTGLKGSADYCFFRIGYPAGRENIPGDAVDGGIQILLNMKD